MRVRDFFNLVIDGLTLSSIFISLILFFIFLVTSNLNYIDNQIFEITLGFTIGYAIFNIIQELNTIKYYTGVK